jgi:hypothetical protein
MGKKSRSGIRIRDEQPGSFSESLGSFFGVKKYLNSLIRIRDPESFVTLDPGWKKFGYGIRDKHPDPE